MSEPIPGVDNPHTGSIDMLGKATVIDFPEYEAGRSRNRRIMPSAVKSWIQRVDAGESESNSRCTFESMLSRRVEDA